ncbi:putative secondary metabolism biosynthetic enzyme [Marasmius oreades]|uniref:Secondary metabolism biosynthetic enzyme n=1 Tax=Marasmius oreades TaxID=181124 RepID=A0A9P7UU16_9AGAR|nr:putative secondary metabolism biosynthetic enzyme [Marasmius oreades]KAG7091789.1 putative secondary metabolism biosynthetic enzyme [Marasmius oreades]
MSSIAPKRVSNASYLRSLSYFPVAVFVGGTSGIGQAMAEAFATHTEGNAHIVIIGRNQAAAENILSKFPKPSSPHAKHEFVQCDVTLMKNVKKATDDLVERLPKIDYLVMSPGYMTMKDRDESAEGIDRKLAVHYYARWKFIDGLLPALKKAKDEGEDAKVYSVLAPGYGGSVDVEDLGLKKSFSLARVALVAPTYNDLMTEEYAARNPGIPFVHAYPGWVDTGYLSNAESSFLRFTSRAIWPVLRPFLRPFFFTPQEAGENMLHGLLTTAKEPRAWRLNQHGEDMGTKRHYGTPEERKALWEHTIEEMKRTLN